MLLKFIKKHPNSVIYDDDVNPVVSIGNIKLLIHYLGKTNLFGK